MPVPYATVEFRERFRGKVDPTGPIASALGTRCHLWLGCESAGYGQVHVGSKADGGMVGAHVVAWEMENGPVPDGMVVMHRCDVKMCCREDHLTPGTPKQNSQDMVVKGRSARGGRHGFRLHPEAPPRGEANGNSKLKRADVVEIRQRHADGISMKKLSNQYGVDKKTISMIVRRITWKEV